MPRRKPARKTPAPARKPARKAARKATRRKVQPVPAAYGSVTPHLVLRDCTRAIAFYEKALGAKVLSRMQGPDGKTMHAEMRVGDTIVMMGDEVPERGFRSAESLGDTPVGLMLYVKDCDAVFSRAVAEGARPLQEPADMFWGDRYAQVVDPFGHRWAIATHTKDLTPRQMEAAAAEFMASMASGGQPT